MLVCNVSQRPPRRAIAAELAEITAALDDFGTGNIVFATLVDDPASVNENVDAFLGEIMLEAANAVDSISVENIVSAAVNETGSATDTQSSALVIATVTWDPATVTSVTMSGGNLVATNTGTTSADQGARVVAASGKSTGKYYFEITWTTILGGANFGLGAGTTASTYTGMGNGGTTGVIMYRSGSVWSIGSNVSSVIGAWSSGQVAGIAVDLDNRRIWFRAANTSVWNGSGSNNPATNTGGYTIPAGTMVPFVTFGGTSGVANNVITANFGASAFTGATPAGFTSGWPS